MLRAGKTSMDEPENDRSDQTDEDFKTLYVIIFLKDVADDTVKWLLNLLTCKQEDGGANLLTRVTNVPSEGIIVEVGASPIRLLEATESLQITKEDKDGNMREFQLCDIYKFIEPGEDINNILSTAEKQRVILEELIGIKATTKQRLLGYNSIRLHPGQSIVQVCKNNGIIVSMFPLHDRGPLKSLKKKWLIKNMPLDDIRNYFGEAIGFYFAFMQFYIFALLIPVMLSVTQSFISFDISKGHLFFIIAKMIYLTAFLVFWKRKSNDLAYKWGTLTLLNKQRLHPTFRGIYMIEDAVTGQQVPFFPVHLKYLRVYGVSLPLVGFSLYISIVVMIAYLKIEATVMEKCNNESMKCYILTQLPGIIYAIIVSLMNLGYIKIATIVTEWENHRTQESFDNHKIVKLLLFEFVNNFVLLGYTAFYLKDLSSLKWQIAVMMIVNQMFNKFLVAVLPFLLKKYRQMRRKKDGRKYSRRIEEILAQNEMWQYEGTYDDYLEMFIQFGYVFLFSSVFPIAAVFAFLNNVLEIWTDRFKLCYAYQRPQARPVKGIGVWQIAFEILSLIAVMSNSALVCMSPEIRSYAPDMSLSNWVLVVVAFEHAIIGLKLLMIYIIPDISKSTKIQMEKSQYKLFKAIKSERQKKSEVIKQSMQYDFKQIN